MGKIYIGIKHQTELSIIRQSDTGFLPTSEFCTQRVFCPYSQAIYTCAYIKVYKVSGEGLQDHWSSGIAMCGLVHNVEQQKK